MLGRVLGRPVRTAFDILHGSRTRGEHNLRVLSTYNETIVNQISYVELRVVPYGNLVFHTITVLILIIWNYPQVRILSHSYVLLVHVLLAQLLRHTTSQGTASLNYGLIPNSELYFYVNVSRFQIFLTFVRSFINIHLHNLLEKNVNGSEWS